MLRREASQLMARLYAVPWYPLWAFLKVVRKKADIEEASAVLMALSNSVCVGEEKENSKRQKKIQKLLGIVRDEESNGD